MGSRLTAFGPVCVTPSSPPRPGSESGCATAVYAASSATSSSSSGGESPAFSSLRRRAWSRAVRRARCSRQPACRRAARRRRAAAGQHQAEGEGEALVGRRRRPPSSPRCGEPARGLDEGDVVQQVQRLQRRVGARLADHARLAAGGVEGASCPAARPCASRTCTGCGGTGPRRVSVHVLVAVGQLLPQPRRLVRLAPTARPAARPAGRSPPAPGRGSSRPAAETAGRARAAGSRGRAASSSGVSCDDWR